MEYVLEFILEFIFEAGMEASKSSKVPKYIRYPLIVLISLFFVFVIGLMIFAGILSLKEHVIAGILLIFIGVFMLVACVRKMRRKD